MSEAGKPLDALVALKEAIQAVGNFVDIDGNEWAEDGTTLRSHYEQWKVALAAHAEAAPQKEVMPFEPAGKFTNGLREVAGDASAEKHAASGHGEPAPKGDAECEWCDGLAIMCAACIQKMQADYEAKLGEPAPGLRERRARLAELKRWRWSADTSTIAVDKRIAELEEELRRAALTAPVPK